MLVLQKGVRPTQESEHDTHVGEQQFLGIVHIGYGGLALAHEVVIVDVVAQQAVLWGRRSPRLSALPDNTTLAPLSGQSSA